MFKYTYFLESFIIVNVQVGLQFIFPIFTYSRLRHLKFSTRYFQKILDIQINGKDKVNLRLRRWVVGFALS